MIKVKVPATSANLGPGFDYVGMALELYNDFYFFEKNKMVPPEASNLLNENSLTHQAMRLLANEVKRELPPIQVAIKSNIPRARGLGSSASLTVAGLIGGNALLRAGLKDDELIGLAAQLEGHADNAVPAFLGGIVVCMSVSDGIKHIKFMPQKPLQVVVAVPEFELPTS
ncbi:MAG: homoserine kinase, partial [Firmicutes bacterium HGW-Firmicutes-12]